MRDCDYDNGCTAQPMQAVNYAEKPPGVPLERRVQLQVLAASIAHMVRGQASRRERCILRAMVETLLDDET